MNGNLGFGNSTGGQYYLSERALSSEEKAAKTAYAKAVAMQERRAAQQLAMERERFAFEKPGIIRGEVSGWAGLLKWALIIVVGIYLFIGGFSAVGAIIDSIKPFWYIWLGALVLAIAIWVRR